MVKLSCCQAVDEILGERRFLGVPACFEPYQVRGESVSLFYQQDIVLGIEDTSDYFIPACVFRQNDCLMNFEGLIFSRAPC
jgi:hypothetical protein